VSAATDKDRIESLEKQLEARELAEAEACSEREMAWEHCHAAQAALDQFLAALGLTDREWDLLRSRVPVSPEAWLVERLRAVRAETVRPVLEAPVEVSDAGVGGYGLADVSGR
jgi:hypothetical protein